MSDSRKNFPLLIYDIGSTLRHVLDKRLKPLGLSQAKWRTLLHLSVADKPLAQTELANRLGIENPTLVGILNRLAQAGWIERQQHNDRRIKTIHLTAKAQTTLSQIQITAQQLLDEILITISEKELSDCVAVLKKIKLQTDKINE